MNARHHIIYIPGLADVGLNKTGQQLAVGLWRIRFGVTTDLLAVGWADANDTFGNKMERLLKLIDVASAHHRTVSLVAASAGASLAIHAFAARPEAIHRVVTIAGAHGPVEDAEPTVLVHNPSLKTSLEQQPTAIKSLSPADRTRILSIKPLKDRVVPLYDMDIEGINYAKLSTTNHMLTIAAALTVHSRIIIDFIKHT